MTPRSTKDIDEFDQPLEPVQERALAWVVQMHSGTATQSDQHGFEAWRAAAPAHAAAAEEAEELWQQIGPASPHRRPRRALLSLAGVVAAGAALGIATLAGSTAQPTADLTTERGEQRSVVLSDGSKLELDADTRLQVAFGVGERRLVLRQGRVYVQVAPDAGRPFCIVAGTGSIRALGTAFSVARTGEAVEVVVTEHAVDVARPVSAGPAVRVQAGQAVTYDTRLGIGAPRLADLVMAGAWRRGRLVFDGKPLGDVVAEIARYRRDWVVFTDAGLRQRLVTGVFSVDDTDALLDALPKMMPVRLRRMPFVVVVEPTAPPR